jgi:hypothetical protein
MLLNLFYWENWIPICKRMELDPYLKRIPKNYSKWIKDLKVRAKTVKLLEKDRRENFVTLDLAVTSLA